MKEYIGGIRKETYDLLFKDESLQDFKNLDTSYNDRILDTISTFTRYNKNSLIDKILMKLVTKKLNIDKIYYDKETKKYNYNTGDKLIPFELLSDNIKGGKKLKKELLSIKRFRKCHERSLCMITSFENLVKLLTGTYERHGRKCLHSIIEVQGEKGEYIVDYTLNLIMEKQNYIDLTKFQNIEEIKDIDDLEDNKDGTKDCMIYIGATLKPYLTFRKELKRDLEKNKDMLKVSENEELNSRIEKIKKQREDIEKE